MWNPWLLETFAWTLKLVWTERAVPIPARPQLTMLHINTLTIERSRLTWDPLPFIIKQLSCLLGNGRSVPSSYGLVSCEQLRDSRSPHNRGGQLEVLAEAGFVLSAGPSGKRAGFQGWWWGEEKCFPFCSAALWFVLRHFWKDLHFLAEATLTFLTSHLLLQAFTRDSREILGSLVVLQHFCPSTLRACRMETCNSVIVFL